MQMATDMSKSDFAGCHGWHEVFTVDETIGAHPKIEVVIVRELTAPWSRHPERIDRIHRT
jgi:hypothetical protein